MQILLADPELPKKVEQNRTDEIVPCIRCFVCHAERMLMQTRVCSLNPEIGRETETRYLPPAAAPRRVLVAGGGPGGMQAALTAARRGHEVLLCERTDRLGGKLLCEAVEIRTGLRAAGVTPEGLLCTDGDGKTVLIEADNVICAAGMRPLSDECDALRGTAPIVETIGDCVRPGLIREATFRAYHAALDL